ncbi:galactose mutarotase [Komagataeibacter nataicola]|uniref:Aldose 1-epimerase n=1 Tax=Komagataeibacter nataicola TaxID=265960 RepID=A0A9N7H139_9PROT|nr:galactose mutarotase [Komagataeibacter nataicola]PYD66444.1 galactose-1-epimerase [Komagataeibacter nataicola]GBR26474.1 aldose 1-epimerase [Komagataeibacter nataicola NRIC 0616]
MQALFPHTHATLLAAAMLMTGTAAAQPLPAPTLARAPFGATPDGQPVEQFTLTNAHGMRVRVLSYGGIISAIEAPDRTGHVDNVVLGFPTLAGYTVDSARGGLFFGATVGRVANRIAHGTFMLEGQRYHIPPTEGTTALHGGRRGFDKQVWTVEGTAVTADAASVTLKLISPDGQEGFPGTLTTHVTFALNTRNELSLHYRATTDRPTVINLTNHSYFNLSGEGSGTVENHVLQLNADAYTPTDANALPLGAIAPVAGTPLDFRTPHRIGARLRASMPQMLYAHGYDQNWIINRAHAATPAPAARLSDPASGRVVEVLTTQPGLQVYTGNSLDGAYAGPSGHTYRQGDGVALETQHYPDSPNHPDFPSIELRPGQIYDETTIYRLGVEPAGAPTP